jgi:two-component system chemotaxis response regulator CheY
MADMEEKLKGISNLPVLVIDDLDSARAVLIDMLAELGFSNCLEARNGHEALDIIRDTSTQIIFCDFIMEGMTGVELLEQMKAQQIEPNAPVIFVSALGDVSSVTTALELGADDYLVKPVSMRKLRRKIEQTLTVHE